MIKFLILTNIKGENMIESKKILKDDKKLMNFIITFLFIEEVNIFISYAINISQSVKDMITTMFMIILLISLTLIIFLIIRRSLKSFILAEMIAALFFCISLIQGNAIESELYSKLFNVMCIYIPLAICVYSLSNIGDFLNYLSRYSMFLTLLPLATLIFRFVLNNEYSGRMSASYALLLPLLFQVNSMYENRKIINTIISFIGIATIFFFGSRGALICIIFFIINRLIIDLNKKKYKKFLLFILILFTAFLIFTLTDLYYLIENYFESKNIYSRTLSILFNDGILGFIRSTDRDVLRQYYIDLIKQKPLFGWGILGGWLGPGEYPHNIVLEFFVSFGIIIGGLFSIAYFYLLFSIFKVKNEKIKSLLLIFFAANIALMFSGTYLTNKNWYILLALHLRYRLQLKAEKRIQMCDRRTEK